MLPLGLAHVSSTFPRLRRTPGRGSPRWDVTPVAGGKGFSHQLFLCRAESTSPVCQHGQVGRWTQARQGGVIHENVPNEKSRPIRVMVYHRIEQNAQRRSDRSASRRCWVARMRNSALAMNFMLQAEPPYCRMEHEQYMPKMFGSCSLAEAGERSLAKVVAWDELTEQVPSC